MLNQSTDYEELNKGVLAGAARFASDLVRTSYGVMRLMIELRRESIDEPGWWETEHERKRGR